MSVAPSELTNEVWTRWQGYLVNDVFPLGRFLGCSDHSGVFLTRSASPGHSQVAIKLIPANQSLTESQLPRWKEAGRLAHPHLLGLLEWGLCELDGLPYLCVVMEYADQTLAQLLRHRALTAEEVREMLRPALEALAFLHSRDLVQGQLQPTNILVVGDQLKLASDTIRRAGDCSVRLGAASAYDAPEVRYGAHSTAADVWALGVTLLEALGARRPSDSGKLGESVTLPADFSPAFRDVVARCLSPSPKDRPTVAELLAWAGGSSSRAAAAAVSSVPASTASAPAAPAAPVSAPARAITPLPLPAAKAAAPRALPGVVLGGVLILAASWSGVHWLRSDSTPAPVQNEPLTQAQAPAPVASEAGTSASAKLPATPGRSDADKSVSAMHEVIPDVPHNARRTIRGHINVWVRVTVGENGSVTAVALDRAGSSGYFQRLAIEAAKKWTFPPIDGHSPRMLQIRFDFTREGTTGRALPAPKS